MKPFTFLPVATVLSTILLTAAGCGQKKEESGASASPGTSMSAQQQAAEQQRAADLNAHRVGTP
jgi:hypothetical protein